MTPYRIAIVGTGSSVGNHLHAVEAQGERVELVAAVDLNEARLNAICEQNHIPHAYTNVSAMLAAEQPDLVSLVTPPATHATLAVECLDAGAWVYSEKPLCASLAEFDAISAAEARTGRYVSTVFQWRFGSAAKHVKRLIETQALGKPLVAVCHTLWYRPQAYYAKAWRGKWQTEIGGPTMTLGIHLMDLLLWLLDDWREVHALADTLDHMIEVEDISMALVRFNGGNMASIINSALSPRQESYLRLDFQQATVECRALYRSSNENWSFSLAPDAIGSAAQDQWNVLADSDDLPGEHRVQLGEILDSMGRGDRPPVSGDEARRILEFAASLYKSANTGKPVRRGEITPDDPYYAAMNGAAPARASS